MEFLMACCNPGLTTASEDPCCSLCSESRRDATTMHPVQEADSVGRQTRLDDTRRATRGGVIGRARHA